MTSQTPHASLTPGHDAAAPATRERIVQAADRLIYQRGFASTSFADIAGAVGLSRGNFYYHFKSKDDILGAVIGLRRARTQAMLEAWTSDARTATARLQCFVQMLVINHAEIQRHGCPVGSLCAELVKLDHPAQGDAGMIFGQFRQWLRQQFEAMGHAEESDALAMHLLSRSQGIAALVHALHDEAFMRHEVAQVHAWLASLRPRRATATRRRSTIV